jgi:hypothetical protein
MVSIALSKIVQQEILSVLKSISMQDELEVRFGILTNNIFKPCITDAQYNKLKNAFFNRPADEIAQVDSKIYEDNIRVENDVCIYKTKKQNINLFSIDDCTVRLSLSNEKRSTMECLKNVVMIRKKYRETWKFDYYQIDITKIDDSYFEIEIEFYTSNLTIPKILNPIKNVLDCLFATNTPFIKITNYEKDKVYTSSIINFKDWDRFINRPVNLDLSKVDKEKFVLYPKMNGLRAFLYSSANSRQFLIMSNDIFLMKENYKIPNMTIYDGEFTNSKFLAFDVLVHNGKDLTSLPFSARKEHLSSIENRIDMFEFKNWKECLDTPNTDGIIFYPLDLPYKNKNTYKYKNFNDLTIDFKIKNGLLYVMNYENNVAVDVMWEPESRIKTDIEDGIVECKWNYSDEKFEIVKIRKDRSNPNFVKTAISIWKDIMNPITIKDLEKFCIDGGPNTYPKCYLKKNEQPKMLCILEPDNVENFDNLVCEDMVRIGSIGDGNCFYHSIFFCMSQKYRDMSINDRKVFVGGFRSKLANGLTIESWKLLGNGELYKMYSFIKIRNSFSSLDEKTVDKIIYNFDNKKRMKKEYRLVCEQCEQDAFEEFQHLLEIEWAGIESIEIISDVLKVNIIIIDAKTRKLYEMGTNFDGKYQKTIYILWIWEHYESLAKKIDGKLTTVF